MKFSLSIFLILSFAITVTGQNDIQINNASFEGEAMRGHPTEGNKNLLQEWVDCNMSWGFNSESPYDVHTATSNFWNITTKPSNGNSFISLIVRALKSYEGISQKLNVPVKKGKCYEIQIDLCKSETLVSAVPGSLQKQNFNTDAVLNISFKNEICGLSKIKLVSDPINHTEWKKYKFSFQAQDDYNYITLNAYWVGPESQAYNGNILLDNMSNLKEVKCK